MNSISSLFTTQHSDVSPHRFFLCALLTLVGISLFIMLTYWDSLMWVHTMLSTVIFLIVATVPVLLSRLRCFSFMRKTWVFTLMTFFGSTFLIVLASIIIAINPNLLIESVNENSPLYGWVLIISSLDGPAATFFAIFVLLNKKLASLLKIVLITSLLFVSIELFLATDFAYQHLNDVSPLSMAMSLLVFANTFLMYVSLPLAFIKYLATKYAGATNPILDEAI